MAGKRRVLIQEPLPRIEPVQDVFEKTLVGKRFQVVARLDLVHYR